MNTRKKSAVVNNKMFYFPMGFMLVATLTSLVITILRKLKMIGTPDMIWGDWFQLIFAIAMAVLAVILVVEGVNTFKNQKSQKTK